MGTINADCGSQKKGVYFCRTRIAKAVSVGTLLLTGAVETHAQLEEVIVTASRRSQNVQDIPYNISAISGDELSRSGATSLIDVVRMVPGLTSSDVGQRGAINSTLILRGINASNPSTNSITQNITDPSVSMYLDDVPLFFNVNLDDIERVEVLRGPQGTLYGSGAVGGTVRFILNKPDPSETVVRVSGDVSLNDESDEINYNTDLLLNLPLSDNFAARFNLGYKKLGGVIDATGLMQTDSNGVPVLSDPADVDSAGVILPTDEDTDEFKSWYARGAFLWDISDHAQATLTFLHQEDDGEGDTISGITDNGTSLRDYEHTQRSLVPLDIENDMLSLDISVDLGFATLTSATSYVDIDQKITVDNAGLYANLSGLYFGYPEDQIVAPSYFEQGSKVFTQEIRLVSQGDGDWDWVVGAWYKDQEQEAFFNDTLPGYERWASDPNSYGSQIVAAYYPGAGNTVADFWGAYYQGTPNPILDDPYVQNREMDFEDLAAFGEVTYHITDAWQVTGGFRVFTQEFSQTNAIDFNILGPDFAVRTKSDADFDDSIFKLNTAYDLNDNTMMYVTWSEGFRHGGANGFPTSGTGTVTSVPVEYDADEATNYEIGLKGTLLDDRIRYSAAIYRIDWDKPQLDVFLGLLAVPSVVNGDKARSEGVELEIAAQFTENFIGTFGWSYTDAELQGDGIAVENTRGELVTANDGDPMPGVPEHQLSLALNYFQKLNGGDEVHYYVNGSYTDSVVTTYNVDFGDYAELDSFSLWNAGVNWNAENWTLGLFVKNLGNEEGLNTVRFGRPDFSDAGNIIRPRSYGLRVSYTF